MGTLDTQSTPVKRFSKIINITGMTPVQTKTALDEFLNKGWELGSIYQSGSQVRACVIRTKEE